MTGTERAMVLRELAEPLRALLGDYTVARLSAVALRAYLELAIAADPIGRVADGPSASPAWLDVRDELVGRGLIIALAGGAIEVVGLGKRPTDLPRGAS